MSKGLLNLRWQSVDFAGRSWAQPPFLQAERGNPALRPIGQGALVVLLHPTDYQIAPNHDLITLIKFREAINPCIIKLNQGN